ncbi:MAG: hypothetical protein ACSHXY_10250 [Alphaproteobacteria bacterium]
MHPAAPIAPSTQVTPSAFYADTGAPLSVLRLVQWVMLQYVMQAIAFGGQMFGRQKAPEQTAPISPAMPMNRQLRRAQMACLRRFDRHMLRGRTQALETYMPKAYVYLAARKLAPQDITRTRFKEFYARESGLGRACVFGLTTAREITAVIAEAFGSITGGLWGSGSQTGITALSPNTEPSGLAPP